MAANVSIAADTESVQSGDEDVSFYEMLETKGNPQETYSCVGYNNYGQYQDEKRSIPSSESLHEPQRFDYIPESGYNTGSELVFLEQSNEYPDYVCQDHVQYQRSSMEPKELFSVFNHLDSVIRKKVNIEIENLRRNIQNLITDQQVQYRGALGVTTSVEDAPSENTSVSQHRLEEPDLGCFENTILDDGTCEAMNVEESVSSCYGMSENGEQECCSASNEELRNMYLIQLLTSSSIITTALQRQEYST